MLSQIAFERLKRGDKLTHVLGIELVFLSTYPMVNEPSTLECRYINKEGEFRKEKFYRDEVKLAL